MGCDIHTSCERYVNNQWVSVDVAEAFDWRSYGMFGFLADVRNYSRVPPIAPQRGLPDDACTETKAYIGYGEYHSCSWLLMSELTSFDYDKTFEDRRTMVQTGPGHWSGAGDAGEGNGNITTFRDFLGSGFFEELERLQAAGVERIVFGFDS